MTEEKVKKRIGFDLDDTLIDHEASRLRIAQKLGLDKDHAEVDKIVYGEAGLSAAPMEGVHFVKKLEPVFDLFVLSRRNPASRLYAQKWLAAHFNFPEKNIFFVEKDEEKALLARELELDYFIDNKLSVLEHFPENVGRFLFDKFNVHGQNTLGSIKVVRSLEEFVRCLPK